jgi:predicted lipoprotein
MNKISVLYLSFVVFVLGCTPTTSTGPNPSDFDRQAILANWADNIIIPALTDFSQKTESLKEAGLNFSANPTSETLITFRQEWKSSYLAWQHVAMFETEKTMELRFRNNLNIYPVDVSELEENINQGNYNLTLSSKNDSQGFPALDYMLNGIGENDTEILSFYTDNQQANSYKKYLTDLVVRIDTLTDNVLDHWSSGYRDEFVNNSGNGANSSLDMMVNDYIFYFEKNLRAGKIGIPAGVFSGNPLTTHVEAFYDSDLSKELFLESINATQNFFNGNHFNSANKGESLNTYLDFLNTIKNEADLNTLINTQFEAIINEAQLLNSNFSQQIESDNTLMLNTYDQLQMNVILLKVDMLQALNINVDYVDADGD